MSPLTLLFILTFLVSVDVRILAPVLPSISISLGSSPGTIGFAMTTYALAYGTGQLFYGPLSDRLGRIVVIRAAGAGFSICTILSALSVTAWQFILVRFLAGALAGAVIPLTLVFIGEGFLLWGGMTYLGAFATDRYRLDQFTVGLLIALFGVGMMVGGMLMDRLRRLFSENALSVWGGVLMGGSLLVLILRWPSPVFAAAMFILGLGYVCLHTTLQLRGTDISSTARGKAFSLFAFSLFLGLATGSGAFGWLVDAGRYDLMFVVVGSGLAGIGIVTASAPQHGASRQHVKTSDGMCIIQHL